MRNEIPIFPSILNFLTPRFFKFFGAINLLACILLSVFSGFVMEFFRIELLCGGLLSLWIGYRLK